MLLDDCQRVNTDNNDAVAVSVDSQTSFTYHYNFSPLNNDQNINPQEIEDDDFVITDNSVIDMWSQNQHNHHNATAAVCFAENQFQASSWMEILKNLQDLVPTLPKNVECQPIDILEHVIDYINDLQTQLLENIPPAKSSDIENSYSDCSSPL